MNLLQAFTDMQVNKIETTKKLKMLEIQAEMMKTSKKKYDITDKEVSNLSPETRYTQAIHAGVINRSITTRWSNEWLFIDKKY